jgi:hypothetical protein
MEVTKWLKPSISVSRIGDSASVQAATRANVEQALYGAFEVKHIFYTTLYFHHSSFSWLASGDRHHLGSSSDTDDVLLVSLRELVFSKSSPSRRSQYDASRNLASGYQTPQGN